MCLPTLPKKKKKLNVIWLWRFLSNFFSRYNRVNKADISFLCRSKRTVSLACYYPKGCPVNASNITIYSRLYSAISLFNAVPAIAVSQTRKKVKTEISPLLLSLLPNDSVAQTRMCALLLLLSFMVVANSL